MTTTHIANTKSALARIFESGILSRATDLENLATEAEELGLTGGATLIKELDAAIKACRAGKQTSHAAKALSQIEAYYSLLQAEIALQGITNTFA